MRQSCTPPIFEGLLRGGNWHENEDGEKQRERDRGGSRLAPRLIMTRMWANAQRDGRPAEYRWRPLFNAAKFG